MSRYGKLTVIFTLITNLCAAQAECDSTSIGTITPLDDLTTTYNDSSGRLYPGTNTRPADWDSIGNVRALEIAPRLTNGDIDWTNGKIGFIVLGHSNARILGDFFSDTLASTAVQKFLSDYIVFQGCAAGGRTLDSLADSTTAYWKTIVPDSLALSSLNAKQVGAAIIFCTMGKNDAPSATWPAMPNDARDRFQSILRIARAKFPNLKVALLGSLAYINYAELSQNSKWDEPYVYWQGYSVKWAINNVRISTESDSISYLKTLSNPNGKVPFADWLKYSWANGTSARVDGMSSPCADFLASDGIHFDTQGKRKLVIRWLDELQSNKVMQHWFVKNPSFYK